MRLNVFLELVSTYSIYEDVMKEIRFGLVTKSKTVLYMVQKKEEVKNEVFPCSGLAIRRRF